MEGNLPFNSLNPALYFATHPICSNPKVTLFFFFALSHASWKETRLPPMTFPLPDWRWVLFPLPRGNAMGRLLLLETGGIWVGDAIPAKEL